MLLLKVKNVMKRSNDETIHPFFLPAKQSKSQVEWMNEPCLHAEFDSAQPLCRMAAFDLDHTLIKPLKGRKFAKDANDWEWAFGNVPKRLQEISKTHRIVIFTNQNGLQNKPEKVKEFKEKLEKVSKCLNISFIVFAAIEKDSFRKPQMFHV